VRNVVGPAQGSAEGCRRGGDGRLTKGLGGELDRTGRASRHPRAAQEDRPADGNLECVPTAAVTPV
jgi:hypothetical protein